MKLPGKRKRGRPKKRFIDAVRGHAGGWRDRGRCRGQGEMETDDPLWQLLMGAAGRRRRRRRRKKSDTPTDIHFLSAPCSDRRNSEV
ncbi:hypothetical protein LDENG_00121400 [Lucifuga dentata]|nr:hypothetical protein LDENG_00121400 [Lucifuga dentata]